MRPYKIRISENLFHLLGTGVLLISSMLFACSKSPAQTPGLTGAPGSDLPAFSTCQLTLPGGLASISARCMTLQVYENRQAETGKQIGLHIAVIPAVSRNPAPDPVFFLAGGPGEAATESFLVLLPAFQSINSQRDIVLVDQRGTGLSNPLECNLDDLSADEQDTQAGVKECLRTLPGDPQFYTTSTAMDDLDQVRETLGYEKINLVGVSYGTRAALFYARKYPGRVRTIVLDGVLPAQLSIGQNVGKDAQRALELIFERCAQNPDCRAAFPDIMAEFEALLSQLDKAPLKVSLPDPKTAEMTEVNLTAEHLASTVRIMSYLPETAALLPLMIHTAHSENNFVPLAGQYLIHSHEVNEEISEGMYFSVICAEDAPFLQPEIAAPGYLGRSQAFELVEACASWPKVNVPSDIKEPVRLEIPTLLISGEADPVTPPGNAAEAAGSLPNSLLITIPNHGHVNLIRGCVPELTRQFIEDGETNGLNSACIENLAAQPFFLNFNGPTP